MATIAFILYPEAGHLNPTFKLARNLKRRGHRIHYFGPVDFEADIRAQGCDFIPILEQLCPRGFIQERAQAKRIDNFDAILLEIEGDGREGGLGPVEEVIAKVKGVAPDLLIVDVLLPDLALILCRQRAPVVLLNIILSNPWEEDPASYKPLLNLPELVLCPADFEFPQVLKSGRRHYLGASIDLEREEAPFQWDRIDGDKPIFYVSLGSQSHLSPFSRSFFQRVIDVMNNRSELQAIVSIGSQLRVEDFRDVKQNITLVNNAPQIKILQKASVMITHGGLGSVKECIFFGVPMIVFPLTREQPVNAARVVYHGLGVRGDVQNASARQIASLIKRIEGNAAIRTRIEIMKKKFREAEDSCDGGEIIDAILSQMA